MKHRFLILIEPAETRCPVCGGTMHKAMRVDREDAQGLHGTVVLLCCRDTCGDGCAWPKQEATRGAGE